MMKRNIKHKADHFQNTIQNNSDNNAQIMHIMAKEDIVKHQFKKGHKMATGRPEGSLNRSTIVKKWFATKMKGRHPITSEEVELSLEDWLTIKQIHKGIFKSDTSAYKVLNDSRYGQAKEQIDVSSDAPTVDFRSWFNFKDDSDSK